jgi:tetratricopeptide (TPR) repeat protein
MNVNLNPALEGRARALARYHEQMQALYQPILSCPWPRQDWPNHGNLAELKIEDLPLFQQAIADLSDDPDLLRALAGDLIQSGRQGEGLALYRLLARTNPGDPVALNNLAGALLLCGNGAEAETWWRQSLTLDPSFEEPRLLLAQRLLDRGERQEAESLYSSLNPQGPFGFNRSLALAYLLATGEHPASAQSQPGLGQLEALVGPAQADGQRYRALVQRFADAGQLDRALELLEQAPPQAIAWTWDLEALALIAARDPKGEKSANQINTLLQRYPTSPEVVNTVGTLLLKTDPAAAAELFRGAIDRNPENLAAMANLALALDEQGQFQQSVEAHLNVLQIENSFAALHLNFGNIYASYLTLHEAEACYRKAILLSPFLAEAWMSLGNVLHNMRQKGPDLLALRKGVTIAPNLVMGKLSLSLALLMYEQFEEGWALYESRIEQNRAIHLPMGLDKWDGITELDELLIVAEQGAGDVVQFMRYSILLSLGIPRITILAEPKYHSLLEHYSGFDAVHSVTEPYRVMERSAWYPMASVLGLLGISNQGVIIDAPYLAADPEKTKHWANAMAPGKGGSLIGLNWQGNPLTENSFFRGRSFPLETYAPLAEHEGCHWVSLQKGPGSEQLEHCSFRHRFVAAQADIDQAWDFVETLSILQVCDLVITSDTSVAHLAGALGRPTWVLLKYVPDWRWGLEGEATPWYPTMRLFRQQEANNWEPVIAAVCEALATFLDEQP